MESQIKLFGHPVHQTMVALPIGALAVAVASDGLEWASGDRKYRAAARIALDLGLLTAAVAAPFGWVDWRAIQPGTRAKRVGLWHALGNVGVLGLFFAARMLRNSADASHLTCSKAVAAGGLGALGVTAWLGGELVNRHGIGIHGVVGPDAPSSLAQRESKLHPRQNLAAAYSKVEPASV
jgi:uncharacterized membrane protein